MKFIREADPAEINFALEEIDRRVRKLEKATAVVLPTTAPRDPHVGQAWIDVGGGRINVWDGNGWTTYAKD